MDDKNKDFSLDPLPIRKESDLKKMLEEVAESLPEQIAILKLRAQMNKIFYDELIIQGFTKEQALELVKVKGI